jgi:uncharacterized protein (DUF433 family)
MSVRVLDRELYTVSYAARILEMSPSTLRWWLEGRPGYQPVIRPRGTGSALVTWGEFVEAGFLRTYRRKKQVSLQRIRAFIDHLREGFEVPYPLAHYRPFVAEGPRLVLEAQRAAGIPLEEAIYVEATTGQVVMRGPFEAFVENIDFSRVGERWAERIHPAGRGSPVVIDPEYAFGAPSVGGVKTETLIELVEAGEGHEEVAREFGLELAEVKAAVAYEWRHAA